MEAKQDKRTNAYKNSVKLQGGDAPVITNPEIAVEDTPPVADYEKAKLAKHPIVWEGNPPQSLENPPEKPAFVKADLLHCPGCGGELLEDERNSKGPAYCRGCIWKEA